MFARYRSQDDDIVAQLQFLGLGALMSMLIKAGCMSPEANVLTLFVLFVMFIVPFYIGVVLITKYFYRFLSKQINNSHVYFCNKYGEKIANRIGLSVGVIYIVGVLTVCLLI